MKRVPLKNPICYYEYYYSDIKLVLCYLDMFSICVFKINIVYGLDSLGMDQELLEMTVKHSILTFCLANATLKHRKAAKLRLDE